MTVYEGYTAGLALLPAAHEEDQSLLRYAADWTNVALAECFETENSIRAERGEEMLTGIPSVSAPEDEIPYSEALTCPAFPYFYASLAAKDSGDNYWAADYRARYVAAVNGAAKMLPGSVTDIFGGGGE